MDRSDDREVNAARKRGMLFIVVLVLLFIHLRPFNLYILLLNNERYSFYAVSHPARGQDGALCRL